MATAALVILTDFGDAAVLAAAKQGLQQLGISLCLQASTAGAGPAPAAASAAAHPAAVPPRLVLGLCGLSKPSGAVKPVLQVRYRPGPFVLRDFHAAVARLAHVQGDSPITSSTSAAALQQLVGVVAQDAACAAAGPHKTVLLLTDRVDYEASDFYATLEVCKNKAVRLEVLLMQAAAAAADGSGDSGVTEALAAAWGAAEAAFPHLSVTVVQGSKLSFSSLASTLLQRYCRRPALAVNLQFKQALLGSVRCLALSCSAELRPLAQAVAHAALCPCHRAPASWATGASAAVCSVTGAPLDRRQCGRDERTVQVGVGAAGALHLSAPFSIAAVAGAAGGGPATLSVLARIKVEQANPALLFGVPLMLAPAASGQGQGGANPSHFKVVHEGEIVACSTHGLLGLLCSSLRDSGEALLAVSTTDLECGAAGLLRMHYLLLPCQPGAGTLEVAARPPTLCAKRVACAEELLAPLLPAAAADAEAGAAAQLPPAVAEAVMGQLAAVPLAERLNPFSLSSRCSEVVEMLVRESQPMPKMQPPPAPPAAGPAQPAVQVAAAGCNPQQPAAASAPAVAAAAPAAQAAKGRRTAAGGGGGLESGGRAGARGGGKGGLDLRRTSRR